MSDIDDILAGEDTPIEETTETTEAVEAPEVEAAPEPEPEQEPETTPEPAAEPEPHQVPIGVVQELRNESRGLKDDLQKALAKIEELSTPKPQEPAPLPDVFEDAEGFANHVQMNAVDQAFNVQLNTSEMLARDKHGDQAVEDAVAAARAAGVMPQFQGKQHVYGEIVKWHSNQKAIQEIGDPTTFRERMRAEVLEQVKSEMAAEQAKEMAAQVTPSLAKTKGTGGNVTPGWSGPTDLGSILGD